MIGMIKSLMVRKEIALLRPALLPLSTYAADGRLSGTRAEHYSGTSSHATSSGLLRLLHVDGQAIPMG
jgi:hypothetical protein